METSLSWLNRIQESGGATEWQEFAETYRPLIARWVIRAGVPRSGQEDVIQDVMLVVVKQVGKFEHRHPGSFRGWLRGILSNVLKQYFRSHSRIQPGILVDALEDPVSSLSALHDREHDVFVALRALQAVRGDFQSSTWQAFVLQMIESKSSEETARALEMTRNAAIKAKGRVLARLRRELQALLSE